MHLSVYELLASSGELYALTLHQPWAHGVAYLGKDVENRTWPPPRERVGRALAIHAGATYDMRGAASMHEALGLRPPSRHSCAQGAVVAVAVLTGARRDSPSRWAVPGQVHWCLAGVEALPQPVPCKGAQGLWKLPSAVLEAVREQVHSMEAQAHAALALSPTEGPPTGLQKAAAEAWAATRPSVRTWHKGSARGSGPAQSSGTVQVVMQTAPIILCPKCHTSRRAGPGPHAPRIMRNPPKGWPTCNHGLPVLADCMWQPIADSHCGWHRYLPGGAQ